MRIGLDARTLFAPNRRGIGKSLLRLYQELAAARPDWQVIAYHRTPPGWSPKSSPKSASTWPADLPDNFTPRYIEMPGDRFDAWTQLRLPTAAKMDRVDLLHCPANVCPRWMPVPTLVTIHDLIPLDMPQGRPSQELKRFEQSIEAACTKAAGVVCPSQYTRDRLVSDHGLRPERGSVVPWGLTLGEHTIDIARVDEIVRRYGIDRSYLLHFGAAEERKNTRGVIEAWAMVRKRYRKPWRLLIVGLDKPTRDEMTRLAAALGVTRDLRLAGFVPENDLPQILGSASMLIYPSLSEGFGLPIIEAFATATAVITSDTTSLPEVTGGDLSDGGAALLVPPGRATALANAITSLMKDPMRRAELTTRGTKRLQNYDWRRSTEHFAQICKATAKLRSGRTAAA